MQRIILGILLLLSLGANSQVIISSAPYKPTTASGGGAGFSRSITIDNTKVPNTDQTDFPVLVTGTYSYLADQAHGGKAITGNHGYDITFTTTSGGVGYLKFQLVYWDSTTGFIEAWVKVPTLTTAEGYVMWLNYGNTSITTYQGDNVNTWNAGYKGVYHFGDGTTASFNDATSNAINGTNHSTTATTGQIGGALNFNGTNQYVDYGNNFGITGDITIELWSNATSIVSILSKVQTASGKANPIKFGYTAGTNKMGLFLGDGTNETVSSSTTLQSSSTWTYLAVTMSSTTYQFYFNGNTDGSGTNGATRTDNAAVNFTLGTNSGVGSEWYAGKMDELRISTTARSADWIKTTYNNQSSPSTFYTLGGEVAL